MPPGMSSGDFAAAHAAALSEALRRASEPPPPPPEPLHSPLPYRKRARASSDGGPHAQRGRKRRARERLLGHINHLGVLVDAQSAPDALPLPSEWPAPSESDGAASLLHREIVAFAAAAALTPAEHAAREAALASLRAAVAALWQGAECVLFGSTATGLALPSSDLDVVLFGVPGAEELEATAGGAFSVGQRTRAVQLLNRLKRALLACGAVRATARVIAGRVPILTCTTAVGGFPADISLGVANGAAAVPLVQALLARYAPLRPLMLVLKSFLEQRSLDSPFTGGIGGYLLLSLVTALLQTLGKEAHSGIGLDLGDALARFFAFYGREFDFRRHGVSIARGGVVPKRPPRAFALAVEDPQETDKDIGAAAFNIRAVRAAFAGAAGALAGHRKAALQVPAAPAASSLWAAVQADGHSRGAAPPPAETLSVLSRVVNVSRALRRRPLPAPAAAAATRATKQ